MAPVCKAGHSSHGYDWIYAVTQDNAIGTLCSSTHGGYSDWENRGFVNSDLGKQLNLSDGFSVRRHVLYLRSIGYHGE
eukprot:SAG31_NODE_38331_length_297_cov_0.681818_1_plen_77_part_01